jgi:LmbE family N-acetylglucosaminyl deacetylase
MSKLLNFNKVLCISPHPDDVELAMLGTIMKYTDTEFHVLCLTICGAKGFDDSYKLGRADEVMAL